MAVNFFFVVACLLPCCESCFSGTSSAGTLLLVDLFSAVVLVLSATVAIDCASMAAVAVDVASIRFLASR